MTFSSRAASRRFRRRGPLALLALLALLGPVPRAVAWGFAAHRLVNERAVATLPPPLRALFEGNQAFVVEHSIDPDLWRAAGREGEEPNHYLNLDAFGTFPFDIPPTEAEHLARYGRKAVEEGRAPWRVGEVYRDLVAAFRARDAARVLERAAVLGHYASDAHVPLHAVRNYDGQLTGQTGVHSRWESDMFERFQRQIEAALPAAATRRVSDPVELTLAALRESYEWAAPALESDRASAGRQDYADTAEDDRYGDEYYSRLYEREGARLMARLGSSVAAVGSLWLSAWEEAGRPELDWSFRFPYVRGQSRLLLVSLDGAAAPVIDDAVARGVMPSLARLRQRGATARGSVTSLPAKTAAGHATLFTGAWPDRHGIAGNNFPQPGASVLESTYGFRSDALRAEPIWVTAARQGLRVATISATQSYPFSPCLEERRFGGNFGRNLTLVDGYQGFEVPEAVYTARDLELRPAIAWTGELAHAAGPPREFSITVGDSRIEGLLYDDPRDPVVGLDTLYLSTRKDSTGGIRLKPQSVEAQGTEAFAALTIRTPGGEVGVHFRLFALSPDGARILLYRSEGGVLNTTKPLLTSEAVKAVNGFTGNGAEHLYLEGALGPPLWQGGDGTAEGRYLETARLVARQFGRLADFGTARTRWDVLVAYLPYPDEALHAWLGYLDPTLRGYDPALATRLRPFLDEALRIADDYVGRLARDAGENTVLAVAADHGMIGVNRRVCLNVALQRAGLLATAPDGSSIDLSRTRAVYFPWNSGYFLINRVSRRGGIVRPKEEPDVIEALKQTLRALRDPETGKPLVTEILDPREKGAERGIGGPQGGDLYFDLAPGYYPSESMRGEIVLKTPPAGEHMLDPQRPGMWAAFTMAGPGVATGVDLGLIRQIDIAPTLCALLGIDPPAQAAGVVLRKALARTPPEAAVATRP